MIIYFNLLHKIKRFTQTKYGVAYLGYQVVHVHLWLLVLQDKHTPLQVDLNYKEMEKLICGKTYIILYIHKAERPMGSWAFSIKCTSINSPLLPGRP